MSCNEFELISRYFNRRTPSRLDVETGIGDDCALLVVPEKKMLATSTDTLVAGVHFLHDIHPTDLAYKALAVNISDLAAMGADPAWLTLALTLPEIDEAWLAAFSKSMFEIMEYYNIQLVGGDTTCGPMSLTFGIHGLVPQGHALKRSGANPGDWIYVTGTLGESAAGLALLQHHCCIEDPVVHEVLIKRHLRPVPRIMQGQALRSIASAAIDLSDGLTSDLSHILKASSCGARLNLDDLPLSSVLQDNFEFEQVLRWALSGGEDYELCFTVPEMNCGALDITLGHLDVPFTCIGQILPEKEGLVLFEHGQRVAFNYKEFNHFKVKEG
ncbi:thiamine-phosphate kinase [Pantoea sp. Nvir]|uniref:thiamine-phosphate kinase n=1 Tax=Pantoea sp. Nvir TaxID=2576760 RepID=UPI0027EFE2CD|nr:thiamine-phosphate kinase [Pantoea sp. Nvir]CAJ0993151.1 Thiamine-monophosphate kinase [Pantoea sp. Nvir]